MRVIVPGHRFALANLKTKGETILQFYQDPELHPVDGLVEGTSTQEVVRAVLSRVQVLDLEKPWPRNGRIVQLGREMLAEMEMRALFYKVQKGELPIERCPVGDDGHLIFTRP